MDEDRQAILSAFERQVAQTGWFALNQVGLAESSGIALSRVHRLFPRKIDLLAGMAQAIDNAVLQEGLADAEESARDRLFEVMMRRMDALQDRRPAIERLMVDLPRDPGALTYRLVSLPQSMVWMLQTARIDTSGLEGAIKVRALAALYALVLPVWRKDTSDDLAPTMKALDERLQLAEELANSFLPSMRSDRPATTADAAENQSAETSGENE